MGRGGSAKTKTVSLKQIPDHGIRRNKMGFGETGPACIAGGQFTHTHTHRPLAHAH